MRCDLRAHNTSLRSYFRFCSFVVLLIFASSSRRNATLDAASIYTTLLRYLLLIINTHTHTLNFMIWVASSVVQKNWILTDSQGLMLIL
ncbi:hypothetical protein RJT34_01066 [Clitoria ternatea]|uniref:Uncharacterized protein n=1 Tax=Clitoria ternatea TaxID=43366 RepID=A0AAN9KIY9_CLITE